MCLLDALRDDLLPGIEVGISTLVEHGSHSVRHLRNIFWDFLWGGGTSWLVCRSWTALDMMSALYELAGHAVDPTQKLEGEIDGVGRALGVVLVLRAM